jgi:hypothetical protein
MTQRPFPRELAAHVTTRTASKAALLRNSPRFAIPKPRQRSTKDAADEKHFPVLSALDQSSLRPGAAHDLRFRRQPSRGVRKPLFLHFEPLRPA